MQASFSELEYSAKQKQTRRDRFLACGDAPRETQTIAGNAARRPAGEGRTSQGEHSSQSRTSIPCGEEPVPTSQDALQRLAQEHGAVVYVVRIRQLDAGATMDIVC